MPEEILQAMLDALVEPAALMDVGGQILAVNKQWAANGRHFDIPEVLIGGNYLSFMRQVAKTNPSVAKWLEPLTDMVNGHIDRLEIPVEDEGILGGVEFNLEFARVALGDQAFILVRGHDITGLHVLKDQKQQLAYDVIREREKERRRIARDLHDSTAQLLVGLQLNIAHLRETAKEIGDDAAASSVQSILGQCSTTFDALQKDLLEFGFLLKPGELSAVGLVDTLDAMAQSFAATTGVQVNTSYSIAAEPSDTIGITIYRLAQEAFANAHRHGHANTIDLTLTTDDELAHLVISNDGAGAGATQTGSVKRAGVGLASMKERVAECGGRISVEIRPTGGLIDVALPLDSAIATLTQRTKTSR